MKQHLRILAIVLALAILAGGAFASGFHVREQGTKAMGMANAFAAQADDPSAIFFNPAGLTQVEGTQASLGVTVINVPETEFRGSTALGNLPAASLPGVTRSDVSTEARGDIFFPPNFYLTRTLEEFPLSFGIGVTAQYPLAKRWSASSPFRDEIREASIKPLNINPTIAYRFDPLDLSVGFGVNFTRAEVTLDRSVIFDNAALGLGLPGTGFTHLGELAVEGDGDGWGYNAGLLWKPAEQLSLAVAYRSKIDLDISGDADYLDVTGGAAPFASFTSGGSTDIPLPDTWSFAVACHPTPQFTLEVDADRFGWSSFEELDIRLGSGSTLPAAGPIAKNWHDVWSLRIGAQYAATDTIDLRAGYAFDNTPIPDATVGPELPDADRDNWTVGIGLKGEKAVLDLAYMYVGFRDRTVNNDIQAGTYKSEAHLFAANLTTSF